MPSASSGSSASTDVAPSSTCLSPSHAPTASDPEPSCASNPSPTDRSASNGSTSPPRPRSRRSIPVDAIDRPEGQNIRLDPDDDELRELADSLAAYGQLQPIIVRETADRFELIAGRRRLTAARRLGWQEIDATVLHDDGQDADAITLTENLQRRQLSPAEEAVACGQLINARGCTTQAAAALLNRSPRWVLDRLAILDWPEALQGHVHAGRLSLTAAAILADIADQDEQTRLIEAAANHGITAATARLWKQNADAYAAQIEATPPGEAPPPPPTLRFNITAQCHSCKEHIDAEQITTLRLCGRCLEAVSNAQKDG